MGFLANFASGATQGLNEDLTNKRNLRQQLVTESAAALRGKLDAATAGRSKKKSAYESAYKLAQDNNIPFSVVDDTISRTSDISQLGANVAESISSYKKAAQDAGYRLNTYGKAEMGEIFPGNAEGEDYSGRAAGALGAPGEMPVEGDTGGGFSTDPGAAMNKALIKLARERGMSPEQAAGLIYELESPGGPLHVAGQYGDSDDVPGGAKAGNAKNASPVLFRLPQKGGGYIYKTLDKGIGAEEYAAQAQELYDSGWESTFGEGNWTKGSIAATLRDNNPPSNPTVTAEGKEESTVVTDESLLASLPSLLKTAKEKGMTPEEIIDALKKNGTYEEVLGAAKKSKEWNN